MKISSKLLIKIFLAILFAVFVFGFFFLRPLPSFGIKINKNNNPINYLKMSKEIYFRQTFNNCAPYSVMTVINILTGEIKDPEVLAKETKWRIMNNLTLPQGVINLLRKYNIRTKEYSLKIYETSIFRALIQGIWSIINTIKLFIFCVFNKKFICHYGIF